MCICCIVQCIARVECTAGPIRPILAREPHFVAPAEGTANVQVSNPNGRLDRRGPRGLRQESAPRRPARPVRTVTVEHGADGETISLTGQVRLQNEVRPTFRLDGRMVERPVHVGDTLKAGPLVALLDPQNQQNALRSAQANLSSAEAVLTEARLTFGRQQELLKCGWTPRPNSTKPSKRS